MPKLFKKGKNKSTVKKRRPSKKKEKKVSKTISSKKCPIGEHWVRKHPMKVRPSKKSPLGVTQRRGHCARNPASKGKTTPKEIKRISKEPSFQTDKKPCPIDLRFKSGGAYDDLIAGWVQYWNDIFKPDDPLDPAPRAHGRSRLRRRRPPVVHSTRLPGRRAR